MQLAMKIIWIINCLWLLKFAFPAWRFEKNAVWSRRVATRKKVKLKLNCEVKFLKLNCELMEKEQDFIFGWEKVQTVKNTQKKKIFIFQYYLILFWGLIVSHPDLGKHVQ